MSPCSHAQTTLASLDKCEPRLQCLLQRDFIELHMATHYDAKINKRCYIATSRLYKRTWHNAVRLDAQHKQHSQTTIPTKPQQATNTNSSEELCQADVLSEITVCTFHRQLASRSVYANVLFLYLQWPGQKPNSARDPLDGDFGSEAMSQSLS